jgi:hypothetical protein
MSKKALWQIGQGTITRKTYIALHQTREKGFGRCSEISIKLMARHGSTHL